MSTSSNKPTVKQQREAQRAAKVAALKKKQATEKRNRLIGIILGATAGVAVLALIVVLVVTNPAKTPTTGDDPVASGDRDAIEIEGLETWPGLTATHVDGTVDYEMTPPAGGDHNAVWLNCGVYNVPQPNENAVHALEHGAVWVTYNADEVSGADLDTLRAALPSTYVILSPYDGLDAPVVASAWGAQVKLDGADDPRLQSFLEKYWKSPSAPEPGAACTGALTGEGKVG
ncbi:DUF3105 domain-containing protein [Schumannella luteola]